MEAGTIASWKVNEGESFGAGDSLAEIETDKATIDFEAQDDGVVAKILVEAGSGEITVGVPIMVTVEDEADVAAFKDFVVDTDAASDAGEVDTANECKFLLVGLVFYRCKIFLFLTFVTNFLFYIQQLHLQHHLRLQRNIYSCLQQDI